jgi:hypothetical protein
MRRVVIAVALLVACDGEPMPQDLKLQIRGLYTSPNEHGQIPPGALSRADDVVLTRDGVAEKRRGQPAVIASPATALIPYRERLLAQSGSGLSITDEAGTALTPFVGTFDPVTGRRMRGAEANGNLYVATASGVKRLDAVDGTFHDAGVPSGLDVDAATTGAAGFLPNDSAVGYRVVWGERDANGNLLLGPPSGRGVVSNASGGTRDVSVSTSIPPGIDPDRHFWQLYRTPPSVKSTVDPGEEFGLVFEGPVPVSASVTSLSRTSNVVTATTGAPHWFAVGQTVRVSPGGSTGGLYAAVGDGVAASSADGATWTARTIPAGWYLGVAWSGSAFAAVGASVAASSADGITWTARTIPAGTYNRVEWNGSMFVAVGASVIATSPDGTTWTARTSPAVTWKSIAWNGTLWVAAGVGGIATSPDGVTWTSRTLPSPNAPYVSWYFSAVGYGAGRWVALDKDGQVAHSTDGVTWSNAGLVLNGQFDTQAKLLWTGSQFVAISEDTVETSPDGTTWTNRPTAWGSGGTFGGALLVVVRSATGYTSTDGVTWTARAFPAGTYYDAAAAGATFSAGEKTITTIPAADKFTWGEAGTNGSITAEQTATPLTASVTDTIPATFTGATLYTSPSQEGALAAQYEPPIARDVAAFRGSMLWFGTTAKAALEVWLLAVDSSGASSGIRAGDTVTINGMAFTAGASESATSRTFKRYTAGTPSQNVANTAASLVRVVNRGQGSPVTLRDMSSANETPGRLRVEARNRTDSITVEVSRAGSWAFTNGQTANVEEHANELRWSPFKKPDANPVTAYQRIGSESAEGLRILALRDSALAFKTDGIWRVTGDGLSYSNPPAIIPLDTTTEIVAPDTVVALDNLAFGLSAKGVVQISDQGGVTILSRPILDQIAPLLVEPMLSTVRELAFGVAYESDGKYMLWVPETADATQATKAFVYDHFASLASGEPVWTVRTDDAACGVVNPVDKRLYTGTTTAIHRERKGLDVTDFADEEFPVTVPAITTSNTIPLASVAGISAGDVLSQGEEWAIVLSVDAARNELFLDRVLEAESGAATVYKAIRSVLEFAPIIPAPGGTVQFQEATFLFRKLGGAAFAAEFASEFSPAYVAVPFDGVAMGLNLDPHAVDLRTWVPRGQQRATRLRVRFTHQQAWSPMDLEGMSVIFTPTSVRVHR